MAEMQRSALLLLDFQVGAADVPFASQAVEQAATALQAAREHQCLVAFSKIDFLSNYDDVAPANKVFHEIQARRMFAPGSGQIVKELTPNEREHVFVKNRFSALRGNNLLDLLRAQNIRSVAFGGITTSGVVLSTFSALIDLDFEVTILADACADSDAALHNALLSGLFPRSATVASVADWSKALPSSVASPTS